MEMDNRGALVGKTRIAAQVILWAAGVRATAVGDWLGAATDRAGRVVVNPDCSVPGHPSVFVIGDAMRMGDESTSAGRRPSGSPTRAVCRTIDRRARAESSRASTVSL
jgi:NADH dehydrogenase FAD-containing subunit